MRVQGNMSFLSSGPRGIWLGGGMELVNGDWTTFASVERF